MAVSFACGRFCHTYYLYGQWRPVYRHSGRRGQGVENGRRLYCFCIAAVRTYRRRPWLTGWVDTHGAICVARPAVPAFADAKGLLVYADDLCRGVSRDVLSCVFYTHWKLQAVEADPAADPDHHVRDGDRALVTGIPQCGPDAKGYIDRGGVSLYHHAVGEYCRDLAFPFSQRDRRGHYFGRLLPQWIGQQCDVLSCAGESGAQCLGDGDLDPACAVPDAAADETLRWSVHRYPPGCDDLGYCPDRHHPHRRGFGLSLYRPGTFSLAG